MKDNVLYGYVLLLVGVACFGDPNASVLKNIIGVSCLFFFVLWVKE